MRSHSQLKELCALAAAGDIGLAESEELRLHLAVCGSCRTLLAGLRDVHAIQLAHLPSSATARDSQRESRIKEKILRRASAECAYLGAAEETRVEYVTPNVGFVKRVRGTRPWAIGVAFGLAGACLAFVLVFKETRGLYGHRTAVMPQTATSAAAPTSADLVKDVPKNRDVELLRARVARLDVDRSRLERLLQDSQSENDQLRNGDAQLRQQIADLSKDLESARADQARVLQRVEQLTSERQSDQTAIAAQNREISSLNQQLEDQTARHDRTRDMLEAQRDLHELVGERNLHMVDVYDTDSRGRTKRAVGRVFYIEGKALVFYAYDLSVGRSDSKKHAYYVWGNKDGNLESVRNLGTLGADDPQQDRWKLQVSNAKVLADIDRVFVTVESTGKLGPRPRGKEILNAYLGGPVNHP